MSQLPMSNATAAAPSTAVEPTPLVSEPAPGTSPRRRKSVAQPTRAAEPRKAVKKAVPSRSAAAGKPDKSSKPALAARATPPADPSPQKPKAAKPAKPAKPEKPEKSAKPVRPPKLRRKPVRDSFTMPEADFSLIATLKSRLLGAGRETKKSELLRAGLHALSALDTPALAAALGQLQPIKIGRPKKGH